MSVRRRGDKWMTDVRGPDGRRHRESGFRTKREAEDWERAERQRLEEEARQDALPASQRRRIEAEDKLVRDLLQDWLDACRRGAHGRPPVEPTTWHGYEGSVRLHITPRIGDLRLGDLDGPAVARLRHRLLTEVSPAKAARSLRHLRQALNYGVEHGDLAGNPAQTIRIAQSAREKRNMRLPTLAEMHRVMRAAQQLAAEALAEVDRCRRERPNDPAAGQRYAGVARGWKGFALLIEFLVVSGLRISEARALRWIDLGFDAIPRLRVAQRASQLQKIGPPKSQSSRRQVVLTEGLAQRLAAWRDELAGASSYVFPAPNGGLLSDPNLRTRFMKPALEKAGLLDEKGRAPFSFHAFRHFHVSKLIAANMNPREVSSRIGHADVSFTLDTYSHLMEDTLDRQQAALRGIALMIEAPAQEVIDTSHDNEPAE